MLILQRELTYKTLVEIQSNALYLLKNNHFCDVKNINDKDKMTTAF